MIPAIGIMIAAYIVTRMVDLIFERGKGWSVRSVVTIVLALGTIAITGLMAMSLLLSGSSFEQAAQW